MINEFYLHLCTFLLRNHEDHEQYQLSRFHQLKVIKNEFSFLFQFNFHRTYRQLRNVRAPVSSFLSWKLWLYKYLKYRRSLRKHQTHQLWKSKKKKRSFVRSKSFDKPFGVNDTFRNSFTIKSLCVFDIRKIREKKRSTWTNSDHSWSFTEWTTITSCQLFSFLIEQNEKFDTILEKKKRSKLRTCDFLKSPSWSSDGPGSFSSGCFVFAMIKFVSKMFVERINTTEYHFAFVSSL